jgi:hypothetical protein
MPVDTAKPKTDVFETARRENEDSTIKDIKKLNLLSNAPARWGSCGIGYYEVFNLDSDNPAKFKEYDFVYHGQPLDIRCLDAQIRRNFTSGRGTLLMDLGYGKRILQSDSLGSVVEAAMVRFVAVRYVLCMNRWLLSPGLSVGAMFLKAGVIRYTARRTDGTSMQDIQADLEMYDHTLRPLLGIDLNFYDVVAANVSMDLLATGNGRFHASLAFLMPFLQ